MGVWILAMLMAVLDQGKMGGVEVMLGIQLETRT
jgi:hypothetical protein